MKKASGRSQRGSKGIKGKHVLQICVLLGVCIWLIYQVKYSHDKKKEFYEKDEEKSTVLEREDGLVKLGRKDLLPGYHGNKNEKEKEDEEEDEEEKEGKSKVEEEEEVVEEEEEDKSKQGEEVADEDEDESKHEEDEIDEQDQSKSEGDDEVLESDEKEKESSQVDEIDMTVHEAREEHYKADDASSAVSHESRVLSTEKMKDSSNNSTEVAQEKDSNATTSEVEVQKELGLKLGEDVSGDVVKKTTTEVKDGDNETSNSGTKTVITESRGETVYGNLTEAVLEASGFLKNETEIMRARSQEDGAPPVAFSNVQTVLDLEQTRNESVSNITVPANITKKDSIQEESRNSTSESSLIENSSGSNTTEVKENLRSEGEDESAEKEGSNLKFADQTEEADDTPERSLSEEEKEADDTPERSLSEEEKEADDTQERSISEEEREALIDTQTLPDIRIEGNEEDEEEAMAAE